MTPQILKLLSDASAALDQATIDLALLEQEYADKRKKAQAQLNLTTSKLSSLIATISAQ